MLSFPSLPLLEFASKLGEQTRVTVAEVTSDDDSDFCVNSQSSLIYHQSSSTKTGPPETTLLQIRIGKPQPLGNAGQVSAIRKQPQSSPVYISTLGAQGDKQVFSRHGGIDKALHQYCADHYARWQQEKPELAHLFTYGGYGENLVTHGLTEDDVCIGDKFCIGDQVVVEISEPRMPCATLNRRFEWRRASVRTQTTGRAGWYLRVLQTGYVKAGDRMRLMERPNPAWSITACQKVLWAKVPDHAKLLELSNLAALGKEIKMVAAGKAKGEAGEDSMSRLHDVSATYSDYRLTEITRVTARVKQFTFAKVQPLAPGTKPKEFRRFPFVQLRFGPEHCFERSYSVVSGNMQEFTLGIALDRSSRGGSHYLHEELQVGGMVSIAKGPERTITVAEKSYASRRRIFVIGGIGVTAFLREFDGFGTLDQGFDFEIHYAVPSLAEAAFLDRLPASNTIVYAKDKGQRLDVRDILPKDRDATIYCCGPNSLMTACQEEAERLGYPDEQIHMESFGEDLTPSNEAFEVQVEGSNKSLQVSPTETLLQVLNNAGFDVPSSCKVGNCGLCVVDYVGDVHHRGVALTKKEKCSSMLSCVSRGKGKIIIANDF